MYTHTYTHICINTHARAHTHTHTILDFDTASIVGEQFVLLSAIRLTTAILRTSDPPGDDLDERAEIATAVRLRLGIKCTHESRLIESSMLLFMQMRQF
jgi:hypothetical protein